MLTVTMVRVATRGASPQVWQNLRIILAVVFGAAVTAVLIKHAAWAAPIAQITSVAVVVVVARRSLEGRLSYGASSPGTS